MSAWNFRASPTGRRAGMVALALLADRVLPEPPTRWHPVAWFGTVMTSVERRLWRDDRSAGLAYAATGLAIGVAAGLAARSTTAVLTVAVAGQQLRDVAAGIADQATAGDLAGARAALPALVGRDPSQLDADGIAAAVIESVAENSVDAMVAPVFWALLGGATGAAAYRAINTMDAMVGHRSERYRRFGTAAARIDDVANFLPAAPPSRAGAVLRAVRTDAPSHPSPNAGVAEAAMAGALGRQVGGPLRYGTRTENRPLLGSGQRPTPSDVADSVALASRVEWLLTGVLVVRWAASLRRIVRS
jgi:adenosylcobinamide-phosphate synthase